MSTPSDDQLCQQAEDFIAANQGKEQSFFRSSELPYFLDKGSAEYECIAALLRNAWQAGYEAGEKPDNATSAWQPIETAPRDGTKLLAIAFGGAMDQVDLLIAWFREGRWMFDDDMENPYTSPWYPAYWQPLPSPPASPTP